MAYQRALAASGTLVLRNEDLDPQRSRQEFAAAMIEDLGWLGIVWQEGPDVKGAFAPYSQSERRGFYLAAWRLLLAEGWIYPCRCSRKDWAGAAQAPHDDEGIYPGTCRPAQATVLTGVDTPAGANWRFRVPQGQTIEFEDGHFGPQRLVAGKDFGDFLVWRRDDVPAYQLAVVVDDAAMEITEVVRGADLLRSTARQILLTRALDLRSPAWFHCGLMLDEHGQRLAKRQDSLSLRALRLQGKSPQEVVHMATAVSSRSGYF
jgi:glutamyl/glutaminyl-tRNA synthetase